MAAARRRSAATDWFLPSRIHNSPGHSPPSPAATSHASLLAHCWILLPDQGSRPSSHALLVWRAPAARGARQGLLPAQTAIGRPCGPVLYERSGPPLEHAVHVLPSSPVVLGWDLLVDGSCIVGSDIQNS